MLSLCQLLTSILFCLESPVSTVYFYSFVQTYGKYINRFKKKRSISLAYWRRSFSCERERVLFLASERQRVRHFEERANTLQFGNYRNVK